MAENYKITGCVLFISDEEIERKGYQEIIDTPIALFYQVDGYAKMYYKAEGHMKILYSYLVKEKYTIKQAQEIYPELFL